MKPEVCDIAILTVLGIELDAMLAAFGVLDETALILSGRKYWKVKINSPQEGRNLDVVIGFCANAGTVSAALRTVRLLQDFSPALLILAGIAAGHKKSYKLGDVVYGKKIADLSMAQAENGKIVVRASIPDWSAEVAQLVGSFTPKQGALKDKTDEILVKLGKSLVPPTRAKHLARFKKEVSPSPKVRDCVIGSGNLLVRDGKKFVEYQKIQPQIKAIEMEAAGMVHAVLDGHKEKSWLVVRGISDFGDFDKDKFMDMQPYAAASAAAYVRLFAEGGYNRRILVGDSPTPPSTSPSPTVPTATYQPSLAVLSSGTASSPSAASGNKLDQELERIRADWIKNPKAVGMDRARSLRTHAYWASALPEAQARVIRFEAELAMSSNQEITVIQQLLSEAEQVAGPSAFFEARLLATQGNLQGAIARLDSPKTLQEWNLMMALLLESEQPEAMEQQFGNPPDGVGPDSESHRLHALACIMNKQIEAAKTALEKAQLKRPDAFGIRLAAALIDYYQALSTAAPSAAFRLKPLPVPLAFVKRDSDSLSALDRAEREFSQLVTLLPEGGLHRELEIWRLAALANHTNKPNEALQQCLAILAKSPTDPLTLQWAFERGYNANSSQSISALAAELDIKL
ncbi:MAG TPA: hypothetical protein VL171_09200 [Verrucomicrobiae bacterium]|nr:hypothetical protein [Verrucomicrobiae bacterium]